jgi:cytochrome c peroxidase
MWRAVCALLVVGGCWSDDPLVDGALTPDQLAHLRQQLKRPAVDPCVFPHLTLSQERCDLAAQLGQELFFDVRMSNQLDPMDMTKKTVLSGTGKTSCATCHDPDHAFIDSRLQNNVSLGQIGWTKRNTPTVIDVALKQNFTWDGTAATAGDVVLIALKKPMNTDQAAATTLITSVPLYAQQYMLAIGLDDMFDGVKIALEAYMYRLGSRSAFDAYIDGDDNAISDAAKRGFGVFVGRGTCIECHNGPALSDGLAHNTGVPQVGPNVVPDAGAGDSAFVTASLRNVELTGPYMHDGALDYLDDVIRFYRDGGVADYLGTRDPRIQPLDLTDDDVRDLDAMLRSLTEPAIPDALKKRLCVLPNSQVGELCNGTCANAGSCR